MIRDICHFSERSAFCKALKIINVYACSIFIVFHKHSLNKNAVFENSLDSENSSVFSLTTNLVKFLTGIKSIFNCIVQNTPLIICLLYLRTLNSLQRKIYTLRARNRTMGGVFALHMVHGSSTPDDLMSRWSLSCAINNLCTQRRKSWALTSEGG